MVMVWVQLVRRISQQNVQENEGNSFYFRKMYGVVNLVGPEVQPSIGNVKHGPLRLPISIDGARTPNQSRLILCTTSTASYCPQARDCL